MVSVPLGSRSLFPDLQERLPGLQLEISEHLEPALAMYMIIAWRIQSLVMLGRSDPDLPCDVVFDDLEWRTAFLIRHHRPPTTRFPGFSIRIGFNLDLSMVCSGGDHGLGRSAHPAVSAGRRRLQDCDVRRSSEATRPGPEAVRRRGPDHGNLWRTAGPSQ